MAALPFSKLFAAALAAFALRSVAGKPAQERKDIEGMKDIVAAIRKAELAGGLPGNSASRSAAEKLQAGGQKALLEAERSWAATPRGKVEKLSTPEAIETRRRSDMAKRKPVAAAAIPASPPAHVTMELAAMEVSRAHAAKKAAEDAADPEGEGMLKREEVFLNKVASQRRR
mmetsp:Transcript_138526/g.430801  ORF Transcript_138526/g.430801 Transcript_138526/m.430801 type:complete len:172 (-) Transcript_138526:25-540(-)